MERRVESVRMGEGGEKGVGVYKGVKESEGGGGGVGVIPVTMVVQEVVVVVVVEWMTLSPPLPSPLYPGHATPCPV